MGYGTGPCIPTIEITLRNFGSTLSLPESHSKPKLDFKASTARAAGSLRVLPLRNRKGIITRWLGTAGDIDSQKRANEKLEQRVRERTAEIQEVVANLYSEAMLREQAADQLRRMTIELPLIDTSRPNCSSSFGGPRAVAADRRRVSRPSVS